jgi:predicted nucleic acid-binding protein
MLLDSNIVIYAARPEHEYLQRLGESPNAALSAISFVEVLGYHSLKDSERDYLETFFSKTTVFPISNVIIDRAIHLRRERNMGLGDAIIAATALVHHHLLVTRNTADFDGIPGLKLVDPFAAA